MCAGSHDLGRDAAQAALNVAAVDGRFRLWGMKVSQRLYHGVGIASRVAPWLIEAQEVPVDGDAQAPRVIRNFDGAAVNTVRLVTAAECKGVTVIWLWCPRGVMSCRASEVGDRDHIGGGDRVGSRRSPCDHRSMGTAATVARPVRFRRRHQPGWCRERQATRPATCGSGRAWRGGGRWRGSRSGGCAGSRRAGRAGGSGAGTREGRASFACRAPRRDNRAM